MEEKKQNEKLTYEQLEAYASQTTAQAQKIFQENQMLKKALYEHSLKEIEIAVKCLDHADKFSPEFIQAIIARIEELMNPKRAESTQEEEEKEN